jgi:drug/metabolite transporter (DMT)-like permease
VEGWLESERNVRVLALLGAATIAFSSILIRLSQASPSTAAIFRCVYALPILGLLKWLEDRRHGPRPWRERRTAMAAGVFFAADLILWTHSIDDVGAGLSTVLANIQVVLVPLIAWALLSERPGRGPLAALPLAALGVLLISGVLEHGAYGNHPSRGAAFGVAAGITYAGFILLLRHGGADLRRPVGPLFDATATAAVVAVIAGVVVGDARLVPTWPSAGWLLTLALSSQVVGWLMIATSLPRLPAAITSVLLMVAPVGAVILGAVILGESPSALQLGGVVLILAALVVATRPRRAAVAAT